MTNSAYLFLRKYHATADDINEKAFMRNFINEMNKGLVNHSSLKMEDTFIKKGLKPSRQMKRCIVLDAGGTNLRGAIACYKNGKVVFSNIKQRKMPFINNKDKFYKALADFIKEISHEHLPIGFCFSFLCQMNDKLDGRIIDFGKNIFMPKVLDTYVATELRKKIKYNTSIRIINDTVAANLGIQLENHKRGNYLSYVLGTGTNISYYENDNLINVESAGFNQFLPSDFEQSLIKRTGNVDVFEKTCGGKYLATLFNFAINKAHQERILHLKKKVNLTLAEYCELPKNLFKDTTSYVMSKDIIDEMIKRIAKMNALMIASIIKRTNNKQIHYVGLEGTTLKKLPKFEIYLKKDVIKYIKRIKVQFLKSKNLNLKGAYFAALI